VFSFVIPFAFAQKALNLHKKSSGFGCFCAKPGYPQRKKGDYLPKVGGAELPTAGPVAPVLTPSSIAWYEMMFFNVS
jgi:hypothetical protein